MLHVLVHCDVMRGLLACLLLLWSPVARAQDRDGDGLLDDADLCPDLAEEQATLFPGDGCPDADADADGVVDDYDVCPDLAETPNGFQDADGCPDSEGAAAHELGERILFETGSSTLDTAALESVARLAASLLAHPDLTRIEVIGRTDARGTQRTNERLSQRRADAVEQALVARGVREGLVVATGRGAIPGESPELQLRNRRVEILVTFAHDPRLAASLTPLRGRYEGDTPALEVQASLETTVALGDGASDVVHPMAGTVAGDRGVLVYSHLGHEDVLVWRRLDDARAVGIVSHHEGASVTRRPWTARVSEGFHQGLIVAAITAHREAIRRCYEAELRTQPTVHGRIEVAMTVTPTGQTSRVRVAVDALSPPGAVLGRVHRGGDRRAPVRSGSARSLRQLPVPVRLRALGRVTVSLARARDRACLVKWPEKTSVRDHLEWR